MDVECESIANIQYRISNHLDTGVLYTKLRLTFAICLHTPVILWFCCLNVILCIILHVLVPNNIFKWINNCSNMMFSSFSSWFVGHIRVSSLRRALSTQNSCFTNTTLQWKLIPPFQRPATHRRLCEPRTTVSLISSYARVSGVSTGVTWLVNWWDSSKFILMLDWNWIDTRFKRLIYLKLLFITTYFTTK